MAENVYKNKPIYLNAFNGSHFDHYFLIKECLKLNIKISQFLIILQNEEELLGE